MRSIDIELVRKKLGSFNVGGKKFNVYEPTLGQILLQAAEAKKHADQMDKIPEENVQEAVIKRHEWLVREVQILVEDLDDETAKKLTHEHRNLVIAMVYGMDVEPEKKTEKTPKKKK